MATCRSCDAEVLFAPSAKTLRPMILDAVPKKGIILRDAQTQVVDGARDGAAMVVDVYTDHHATCPDAAAWRGTVWKGPRR